MDFKKKVVDFKKIKAFAFDVDGVFTDGSVLAMPDGDLLRTYNSKDCMGIRMATANGFPVGIITGGCSKSIIERFKSLGVKMSDLYQLSRDKTPDFMAFCQKYNLSPNEVAFVGDDIPDIGPLKVAGLSVCPSDAIEDVKIVCNYISSYPGGKYCVRDIVEKVLKAQEKWYFNPKEPWDFNHPAEIMNLALETGENARKI